MPDSDRSIPVSADAAVAKSVATENASAEKVAAEAAESIAAAPRASVADRVAAEILELVASGEVGPGDRLPAERRLADDLGVSRVSVRAALQRLKAQGFLASVQGGGTKVVSRKGDPDPALAELARLDRSNLVDLMELRRELEVWAAGRAAERASDADIAAVRAAFERQFEDGIDKAEADVAFHMAVARASESPIYRHLLGVIRGTLSEMLKYHRTELFATPEDDQTVLRHHGAVVEAIEARDPERAEDAMRTHLTWAREHYVKAGFGS